MNVVGRVGNLISQGVYSVATPFHPFGGAVDIIVVEQEDGTYRSTPWYVRFGKFQGVMKGADKIVSINVNGCDANFHMFLDHSGQAYFMREVPAASNDEESSDKTLNESSRLKSNQGEDSGYNGDDIYYDHRGGGENDQLSYGYRDEQSSPVSSSVSPGFGNYSYGKLDEVEDVVKSSNDSNSEMVLISVDGHVLTAPISSNEENLDNVQLDTPQFHLGPGEGAAEEFGSSRDMWVDGLFGDLDASTSNYADTSGHQLKGPQVGKGVSFCDEEAHNSGNGDMGMNRDDMFKSCLDLTSHIGDLEDVDSKSTELDRKDNPELSPGISSLGEIPVKGALDRVDYNCSTDTLQPVKVQLKEVCVDSKQKDGHVGSDVTLNTSDLPCSEISPVINNVNHDSENISIIENMGHMGSVDSVTNDMEQMGSIPERSSIEGECSPTEDHGLERSISGLGFEISLCANLLRAGMGRSSAEEAFEGHQISEEEFKAYGPSIIKNGNLVVRFKERYFRWDKAAYIILGKAAFGLNFSEELKDAIPVEHVETAKTKEDAYGTSPSSSRGWRLWPIPFRSTRSLQHSNSNASSEELFVDSESGLQSPNAEQMPNVNNNQSPRKQLLRTYIPTTEQIASLNLKDGLNRITFNYSTRVLGKQEVDAHIYLWKWNTRIVISDVDGTITKSDVLGQVMPLVGRDWTQSGVAGLFSAIKENGYQLLFLSARAIVQAYLTRSFLLNLKQDGKALPSGPVVISPDGLFPSLYREVIRRAPHEFKIACLEDIRALFPSDYNPFYAGFGNRDTDELSYRKIGIPKGKIFIINPKGEVAINHCIDVKSYTSLHTLVNDMFPPTSLVEQEDFNSWNYWKMPLPDIAG